MYGVHFKHKHEQQESGNKGIVTADTGLIVTRAERMHAESSTGSPEPAKVRTEPSTPLHSTRSVLSNYSLPLMNRSRIDPSRLNDRRLNDGDGRLNDIYSLSLTNRPGGRDDRLNDRGLNDIYSLSSMNRPGGRDDRLNDRRLNDADRNQSNNADRNRSNIYSLSLMERSGRGRDADRGLNDRKLNDADRLNDIYSLSVMNTPRSRGRSRDDANHSNDIYSLPSRSRGRDVDNLRSPQELPDIIAALNSASSRPRSRSRSKSRSKPQSPAGSELSTPVRARRRRSSDHYITRSVRRRRSSIIHPVNDVFNPTYVGAITVDYLRSLCRVSIEERKKFEQQHPHSQVPGAADKPQDQGTKIQDQGLSHQPSHIDSSERPAPRFPEEFDHSLPLPSDDVLGSPINSIINDPVPLKAHEPDSSTTNDDLPLKAHEPNSSTTNDTPSQHNAQAPTQPLIDPYTSTTRPKRPGFKSYLERILEEQRKKRGRESRLTSESSEETYASEPQILHESGNSSIQAPEHDFVIKDQTASIIFTDLPSSSEDAKFQPEREHNQGSSSVEPTASITYATARQDHTDQGPETTKDYREPFQRENAPAEMGSSEMDERTLPRDYASQNDLQDTYVTEISDYIEREMDAPTNDWDQRSSTGPAEMSPQQEEHNSLPPVSHQSEGQASAWNSTQLSPNKIVTPRHNVFGFPQDDSDGRSASPSRLIHEQYTLDKDDLEENFSGGLLEELGNFTTEPFEVEIPDDTQKDRPTEMRSESPQRRRARSKSVSSTSDIPLSMVKSLVKTISLAPSLKKGSESSKKRKRMESLSSSSQEHIKEMSDEFLQVLVSDLEAYAEHRKSKHIGLKDVILFFNRMKNFDDNGVTEIENISRLAQNFLPLELLIALDNSLAESSGVELPKKSPRDKTLPQKKKRAPSRAGKDTSAETGTRHLLEFSDSETETIDVNA